MPISDRLDFTMRNLGRHSAACKAHARGQGVWVTPKVTRAWVTPKATRAWVTPKVTRAMRTEALFSQWCFAKGETNGY